MSRRRLVFESTTIERNVGGLQIIFFIIDGANFAMHFFPHTLSLTSTKYKHTYIEREYFVYDIFRYFSVGNLLLNLNK